MKFRKIKVTDFLALLGFTSAVTLGIIWLITQQTPYAVWAIIALVVGFTNLLKIEGMD